MLRTYGGRRRGRAYRFQQETASTCHTWRMVITPHALVGAAVSTRIPGLAGVVLAVGSHYALDRIPHDDYQFRGHPERIALDAAVAGLAVLICSPRGRRQRALVGAAAAILPDVASQLWWRAAERHPDWLQPAAQLQERLHSAIHRYTPQSVSDRVLLQGSVAVTGALLLSGRRR